MIAAAKRRWEGLPERVRFFAWILGIVVMLEILVPLLERLAQHHPLLLALVVGVASYTFFCAFVFLDWRHGQDTIRAAQKRLSFAHLEPDAPLIGVWVILGACALVCGLVIWAALVQDPDRASATGSAWLGAPGGRVGCAVPWRARRS